MTRVITIKRPPVKPHRKTPRAPGRFGQGILRWTPHERRDYNQADLEWYIDSRAREEKSLTEQEHDYEAQRMVELGCYVW